MNNKIKLIKSNHKKSYLEIIGRLLWIITWNLFASWTPRPFNVWRTFLLKCFGAKIGKKVLVFGSVTIDMPWNLEIGDYSAIGKRVWVYNFAKISIGSNTVISQDTTLCGSSHDYNHPFMPLYSIPIKIGNQVWVAAECFVMPGITIGEGTVVGSRSLVTKNLPKWKVCAGNPCRIIKDRIISV